MAKHRCSELISNALNKGSNFIVLHGNGIDDLFLYDFYYGVRTSLDNFKLMFLQQFGFTHFIHITEEDKQPKVFATNEKEGFHDITEDYFVQKEMDADPDDPLADISKQDDIKTEGGKQLQEQMNENSASLRHNLVAEKIRQSQGRTVVYFERFDFYAALYSQNADVQVKAIKRIHHLQKLKNCVVMISMTNADKLKPFDIKTTGSNVIYIGNPAAPEIKYTYLRMFLRSISSDCRPAMLKNLEEVAQAISTSDKLLSQAVKIFDQIVIQEHKTDIDKREFEIALENIVPEKVMLDDVVMETNTKNEILRAVDGFLEADDNLAGRKGIILTGPPGTGKTHIIKAIANERSCFFLAPTLADLKGEFVGQTSGKVSRVFSQARANSPTILFIDEADTIFPERNGYEDGDSFTKDMVNQFLVEIDGLVSAKQKIFVIAATNRVEVIDRAIASRLTQTIEVRLPDKSQRMLLLHKRFVKDGIEFEKKPFSDMVADRTENMSGRDIDNFAKKVREYAEGRKLSHLNDTELERLFIEVLDREKESLIDELRRDGVEVYAPEELNKTYLDIIGYIDEKKLIDRQIQFIMADIQQKRRYETFGITPRKGILLYGPPGNGKTDIVKAAAGQHQFYLIKILSKDFVSASPQEQLYNLQNIFSKTNRLSKIMTQTNSGIILFFDEFDSLAGVNVLNKIVRGTLLDYMTNTDGLRSVDSKILFIAATNFYDLLDEALIRKGRIDEHIFLDNPSEEIGKQLLIKKFEDDVTLDKTSFTTNDIRDSYDQLLTKKRKEFMEAELQRMRSTPYERSMIHNEEYNALLQEESERITPSIVEILNHFDEIKLRSFYKQQDGKLIKIQFNL